MIKEKLILPGSQNKLCILPGIFQKVFIILLFSALPADAQFQLQNAFPDLSFEAPVDLQSPNDSSNRIFIIEQQGIIELVKKSAEGSIAKTFLDLRDRVSYNGEMGLLGLAFHPEFKNNKYFFVDYTKDNPRETLIARFKVSDINPDSADENSELILMRISQPYANHNGGQIAFGPDGFLYIALGDGGSGGDPQNRAQNLDSLLGKILRINVDSASFPLNYSIPQDNPFKDNHEGFREEIFAYGLRNPWRFSFDFETGKLWCGDVGQDKWEEIDIIEKGKNFGWRCYEGNHEYNLTRCNDTGYVFPIWEYSHSEGRSITGGYVYRGDSIPELKGKYIYADFETMKIWALNYDGINPAVNELLITAPGGISSFGVDQENELYLCCFDGNIYNLRKTLTDAPAKEKKKIDFYLLQNYPNPFNPATRITYKIPEESRINIQVTDVLGKEISEIVNRAAGPGVYIENWDASSFPSGVYFISIKAESLVSNKIYRSTVKALLLK